MSVNKLERPVGFRYLMAFSIPTILSHVCMGIYGVVDGIFASNCIGTDALSCVNICMPVVMITIMIGTMLGTGGGALLQKAAEMVLRRWWGFWPGAFPRC